MRCSHIINIESVEPGARAYLTLSANCTLDVGHVERGEEHISRMLAIKGASTIHMVSTGALYLTEPVEQVP